MSPLLTAPPEAPPRPPPERPGYFAVAWATFIGYLWTVLLGLLVLVPAAAAGLFLIGGDDSVGRGVFVRYDFWSWAAEACVGLLAVGLTSLIVGWAIRTRTGWEVSFGYTFLVLLITGYAPMLAVTPLYGAAGLVSLGLAALALRLRLEPSGAEPRTALGAVPRRHRRIVAAVLAVGVPVMAFYALAYAATHPVSVLSSGGQATFKRDPGALERYSLSLISEGRATVTDLSITRVEGSPALQVERIGIPARSWSWDGKGEPPPPPLRQIEGLTLDHNSDPTDLELELRQARSCTTPVARLDAVWLRYRVLGGWHEQRLPLDPPPSVRCR